MTKKKTTGQPPPKSIEDMTIEECFARIDEVETNLVILEREAEADACEGNVDAIEFLSWLRAQRGEAVS